VIENNRKYEVAIIFHPELDDKKANVLVDKYLEIVTENNGTVEKIDIWGRRSLAYPIKKQTEGTYVIVNFSATSETTNEFTRRLGLDEQTLRYKVFKVGN
jgi:small subunit ribosomal protein S6